MQKEIDISPLMRAAGIDHQGSVIITEEMSGLEEEVKDDWLYIGLCAIRDVVKAKAGRITSMAAIGSGNGIETIAALKLIQGLEKIVVTDVLQKILAGIRNNIMRNMHAETFKNVSARFVDGRDCEPVTERVDLIYANLPLIMVEGNELLVNRATTTLTDARAYAHLSTGPKDRLRQYSLLSQLGFLLSAKEKLQPGGSIITLLGGRVPYEALDETFQRAGLHYRELSCAFKRQSDPEFLFEYASHELKEEVTFLFYDYEKAVDILRKQGIDVPDIIKGFDGARLKALLADAAINANQAYALAMGRKNVGHIAFAFEAWAPAAGINDVTDVEREKASLAA